MEQHQPTMSANSKMFAQVLAIWGRRWWCGAAGCAAYEPHRDEVAEQRHGGQLELCSQGNGMRVTKVITGIAVMIVAICIRIPLFTAIVSVRVMRLVKTHLVNGFRHAFHAYEEHGCNQ